MTLKLIWVAVMGLALVGMVIYGMRTAASRY